jgi:hypothetical protein
MPNDGKKNIETKLYQDKMAYFQCTAYHHKGLSNTLLQL